ncbi:hypothetical protein QWI17_16010 [Gilvimarinus sp. SDUM040013]|uniref:Sulfotransferase n=1 Tax=Gilvimarinus gilvus TaxID=3058038 RepID=A0ABU4RW04_9GAMM|nr:hypothetical protein [Gilvimarinus sp. SDUM040013]MDO3387346.1 hypothetical protein [Gilvimarinus sp. SDUM040013]MDX6849035.1 hypothetical protein [Gilvimarinus sp. SDUM040013]
MMQERCIHIGLPKAGSTYLQTHVKKMLGASFLEHPALKPLRLAAFGEQNEKRAAASLKEALKGVLRSESPLIVSDERLSSWRHFDFRFLSQSEVLSYQERCCSLLYDVFAPAKVLLLARNPRDWLRSLHGQYVKAGESLSLDDFCSRNEGYLRQASCLDNLSYIYERAFGPGSVEVFPVEAMGFGTSSDWRCWLNQVFGLNIEWSSQPRYSGLDGRTLEAVRQGNRIIDQLGKSSGISESKLSEFKRHAFRFIDSTLVDQPYNQKRFRRLLGSQADKRSPPEPLVEEILSGMKKTIMLPRFDTVRHLYS